jgi:hypothetical protein
MIPQCTPTIDFPGNMAALRAWLDADVWSK